MTINSGTLKKTKLFRKAFVVGAFVFFPLTIGLTLGLSAQNDKAYEIIDNELDYPKYQINQTTDLKHQLENGEISNEEYDDAMEKVNDKEAYLKEFGSEEQIQRFYAQKDKRKPLFYSAISSLCLSGISAMGALISFTVETAYEDRLKKANENLLDENTPI